MSFTNPAPIGGYVTGDLIDESEINYWCSILPDAIDGAGGGTYTLSAPLIIDGDTVEIETLNVAGELDVAGDVTLGTTVLNLVDVTGDLDAAGSIHVTQNFSVGGISEFTGAATFDGNVTLGSNTSDAIALKGIMTPTSGGRDLQTATRATAATPTIDVTTSRYNVITYGTSTSITLNGTTADGDMFTIFNDSGVNHTLTGGLVSGTLLSHEGVAYVRISGTFYAVSRWSW